jgi:hypothetical protein
MEMGGHSQSEADEDQKCSDRVDDQNARNPIACCLWQCERILFAILLEQDIRVIADPKL